jgi:hypothetical protein
VEVRLAKNINAPRDRVELRVPIAWMPPLPVNTGLILCRVIRIVPRHVLLFGECDVNTINRDMGANRVHEHLLRHPEGRHVRAIYFQRTYLLYNVPGTATGVDSDEAPRAAAISWSLYFLWLSYCNR